MFKKILYLFFFLVFFFASSLKVSAAEAKMYFFWAEGCPHCTKEKIFLDTLENKYPDLIIEDYDITKSREGITLLQKISNELNVEVSGVPFTVVGEKYFIGYLNNETTGKEIELAVSSLFKNLPEVTPVPVVSASPLPEYPQTEKDLMPETIEVPIFGKLEVRNLSLPLLTFILALLDGFNPCAMWTLIFLISLLIGMDNKKRIWILGTAFIVSSSVVYFLFLSAWLNLFLFLGFVVWVRIIVGIIAVISGGYYLRDWYVNKSGMCKVTGNEKRQKVFEKLKEIVTKRQFVYALGGIILLAFAVNMVELVCSAGLPAIYTKILSLSSIPPWKYYLYLFFYTFIFMIDDLIIFIGAMFTLKVTGIQGKYSRFSHLIGGILMFIIGLILLLKPELLMFG